MSDLVLRDVRKTYRTKGRPEVEAVRGFDLEVHSGELVGLLGPSGCGKSTMLRLIAGLLPASADREELARTLAVAVDGAIIRAQFDPTPATALAALDRIVLALISFE